MTDSKVKPPLRLDLHTAMGDPAGVHTGLLPQEAEYRAALARREIGLADYWFLRGYRLYLGREYSEAVESLNVALLHEPGRSEAHFVKGVCLQLLGLAEAEASADFPVVVPPRAHALLLKARWSFSIALELNPHDDESRTYIQGLEALLR